MSQKTTVCVKELSLPFSIGILDHERTAPQTVVLSIEMDVDIPRDANDAAQNYVSYAPIVEHLTDISRSARHIDLVEQLADEIFDFVFKDARVLRARVAVMKPEIFAAAASVGVVIERENTLK